MLRSLTKYSSPWGDHSGWKMDSVEPPATSRAWRSSPSSSTSATHSSHPSHGMLG
ncbi:hypothetical protein ACN28S_54055 [Cystobacter fuscus]